MENNNHSIFKPLCSGDLDELKDKIYEEQFSDHDEVVGAENVLKALQNLRSNPKLLDYVLKCLSGQKIITSPNKFYAVVVNVEKRMEYNEKIHGTFERYVQFCVDGDFGLKKCDKLLDMTFQNIGEIEDQIQKVGDVEIFGYGSIKFEKYSIHEIGI